MGGNIRFAWNNLWDTKEIQASSQEPLFPASNTQNRLPTLTWRSTTVSEAQELKIDLGSPQEVSVFIIRFHNLTSQATIELQGNDSDEWDSPAYKAKLPIQSLIVHYLPETMNLQYWRVIFSDTANPSGYIEVGRIYLGGYFEPTRNFSYGNTLLLEDPSVLTSSEGGQLFSVLRTQYKRMLFPFRALPESDKDEFISMFLAKGLSGDFFITEDPSKAGQTTYHVRFASPLRLENVFLNYYDLEILVEEIR